MFLTKQKESTIAMGPPMHLDEIVLSQIFTLIHICFFLLYNRAHQHLQRNEKDKDKTEESIEEEEDNQEHVRLPYGHLSARSEENNSATENRYSWPINSEQARNMRKEFVLEGFRRLYSSSAGRDRNETRVSGLELDNGINHDGHYEATFQGARLDWQQSSSLEANRRSEASSDEPRLRPDLSIPTDYGDWVYLAQ